MFVYTTSKGFAYSHTELKLSSSVKACYHSNTGDILNLPLFIRQTATVFHIIRYPAIPVEGHVNFHLDPT